MYLDGFLAFYYTLYLEKITKLHECGSENYFTVDAEDISFSALVLILCSE